ncbi:cytosine deaminase [Solibacillus merdavium]|uniref:Cytosine deaminase n=1 Tax=Solibacillus merdavium TaxID=2762218 RepID=A0ABR8XLT1_9BACL|nr:cytosine deaminase [Solibacillus merdavium]MBD8032894.1 cytosine deaminase [Solibacillus merdavium]
MELNLMKIDEFLKMSKSVIRRANERDVLSIKNELLILLNEKTELVDKMHIRKLINEIQFLNVFVVKDDYEKTVFSYEPPKYYSPRVTIKESGWIELIK